MSENTFQIIRLFNAREPEMFRLELEAAFIFITMAFTRLVKLLVLMVFLISMLVGPLTELSSKTTSHNNTKSSNGDDDVYRLLFAGVVVEFLVETNGAIVKNILQAPSDNDDDNQYNIL